ncbi:hypothetical protein [Microbispora sp. NPDC049125]|uniref:hypothetical protein n=1 Tax=Microbispora sp. NPDC049125 TaxID=3154929 RepID=UPI003466B2CE
MDTYTLEDLERLLSDSADGRRFLAKIELGEVPAHEPMLGPCIVWKAATDRDGYSQFRAGPPRPEGGRALISGHLWLHQQILGPVREGYELDHLCHNREVCARGRSCPHRRCVIHTQAVPQILNWARGGSPPALNANKDECDSGHPFTRENTYVDKDGWRHCRICHRVACAEYNARRRAALARLRDQQLAEAGQLTFDFI